MVGKPELIHLAECVVMLMHLTRGVSWVYLGGWRRPGSPRGP
jgi:hypothetical protein